MYGIAGVNTRQNNRAVLGIAGVDRPGMHHAVMGVAGRWGSTIRPMLKKMVQAPPVISTRRMGDRVAARAWQHAVYFSDWTYLFCTDGAGGIRWRDHFEAMFSPENRPLPLGFDASSFRIHCGTAPRWASLDRYHQAFDLGKPEFVMHMDVIGDQAASLRNYEAMVADGRTVGRLVPVWQIGPSWDDQATVRLANHGLVSDAARVAIANARAAVRDPILQHYASRHSLIAIGGMVRGQCPREVRHLYLAELCRLMPDHRFWALGQASHVVINGLGMHGLLDQVSVDGSWWIHNARCESIAVVQDGLIKAIRLEGTGARSLFTFTEMMLCNLRSGLGAYNGDWTFPDPAPLPTDPRDPEAMMEIKRRIAPEQLTFREILGPGEEDAG